MTDWGATACASVVGGIPAAPDGEEFWRTNPADASDTIGPYYAASGETLARALRAAGDAQATWAALPPVARGDVLRRAAALMRERSDAIARDLVREEGKTLNEAQGEVLGGARIVEFTAAADLWSSALAAESTRPDTLLFTRRFAIGVAALVTPWNFPFSNPCIKIAAALIAGNAVVWKPAEWTPRTALHLTSCLVDAGIPEGVMNTVLGDGRVGARLIESGGIGAISFTGSTAVGKQIRSCASRNGVPCQLEMGGKNATVVLADADIERAARDVASSAFLSAGQKCTATSRVIIAKPIYAEFLEALESFTSALKVGDPVRPETEIGPMVHLRQAQRACEFVEHAVREGARLLAGSGTIEDIDGRGGVYVRPVIADSVHPPMPIATEEVFGPVLVVLAAAEFAEALALANATKYGLTAAIYTQDVDRALDFAARCDVGVVKVNEPPPGLEPHVPTGGWKESGSGPRELGTASIGFFSREKTIYVSRSRSRA